MADPVHQPSRDRDAPSQHQPSDAPTLAAGSSNGKTGDESIRLEGLRHFLDEWSSKKTPQEEQDNALQEMQRETAKASIYSMYTKQASRKDDKLVDRWTETLNIILTFAGLQSAAVIAFIIAVDVDLKPDTMSDTNKLLQRILFSLDNSTVLTINTDILWAPPASAVRVSAWWYISLACSMLAAFGALLSKQWIMHYRSQPAWANTKEKRAQLREARYLALKTWWFFAIIETLPILMQFSLLFFAIGLADYLSPISSGLFTIVMWFVGFGIAFYVLTIIAGTIFPACPFKSPVTHVLFEAGWTLMAWALLGILTLFGAIAIAIGWMLRYSSEVKMLIAQLKNVWRYAAESNSGYGIEKHQGEAVVIGENSVGAAGVLCWWVHRESRSDEDAYPLDAKAAVDSIVSLPPRVVLEYFHKMEIFHFWAGRVVDNLDGLLARSASTVGPTALRENDAVQAGDALCHFMYHSASAARIALSAVNDGDYDDVGHLCQTIRKVWTDPNATGTLPIRIMRWTTVAVYLRVQLEDWCDETLPENAEFRYRSHIVKELPIVLGDRRLEESLADVANVVSLAAVALVRDEDYPHATHDRDELASTHPCEQLFLALHRLSWFSPLKVPPIDGAEGTQSLEPAEIRFSLLIRSMRISMAKEFQSLGRLGLFRCSTWKSGELAEALLRLLDLGLLYRDAESLTTGRAHEGSRASGDKEGAALVREVFAFMLDIFEYLVRIPNYPGPGTGLFPFSSPEGLAKIFNGYTFGHSILPLDHASLRLLDHTLGLRYHIPIPGSRFKRRPDQLVFLEPQTPLQPALLKDNTQILQQLIHDIQDALHKRDAVALQILLSVIVKGRDRFIHPSLFNQYEGLVVALSSIAQNMLQAGTFLEPLDQYPDFEQWDELLRALLDSAPLHEELSGLALTVVPEAESA